MGLRDFLIEMYLKHGEREFVYDWHYNRQMWGADMMPYIDNRLPLKNIGTGDYVLYASYLTPAAIKLIKEGTE